MKPECALPGAGGVLLVRVRGDQAGVQVDHDPPILQRRPRTVPDPVPRHRPRRVDRRQDGVSVRGQGRDQPRHRRIRGDPAEHTRLSTQHRDVAGSVPAQGDRDRQIGHDLARVVHRERLAPPPQQLAQLPGQAAAAGGLHQQDTTRMRHQRLAANDHRQPRTQVFMLHPRSASQLGSMWSRQPTSNPAEQALPRIQRQRVATRSFRGESPRLDYATGLL